MAVTPLLLAALVHGLARESLQLAASGLALFSLDDIAIDLIFFARAGWRRCTIYRMHDRTVAATLRRDSAAAMAIIVPAWDESGVIGAMLRDLTSRLDYPNYRVFVGVYPNDDATREAVAEVPDRRITIVGCDRPGPTTKADCLNHLWRAVVADETSGGERFKAVVLHDAEDVVDARELQVFDHLIGRLAMVQLPVVPLVDPSSRWVSGHYLDEFAEAHGKDMVVREALGAAVPSAGVACAIDRNMLQRIADLAGGDPFDPDCLTEDYEIGLKIKALGGRGALVRIAGEAGGGVVATREHFPATIDTALRQKTRWLLGIAFGGWDRLGWRGGWADRFMLMRDRKVIVAALLTLFGYVAMTLVLLDTLILRIIPATAKFSPLVAPHSLLAATLMFTTSILLWRLAIRAGFTASVYGWREGLRAVPRVVIGNLINAFAAWRATGRYLAIRRGRAELVWDKTAHRFPGVA